MAENLPGERPPGSPSPPPGGRPSGPLFVVMPRMGETVDEGTVNEWFKQVGDPVTVIYDPRRPYKSVIYEYADYEFVAG